MALHFSDGCWAAFDGTGSQLDIGTLPTKHLPGKTAKSFGWEKLIHQHPRPQIDRPKGNSGEADEGLTHPTSGHASAER